MVCLARFIARTGHESVSEDRKKKSYVLLESFVYDGEKNTVQIYTVILR